MLVNFEHFSKKESSKFFYLCRRFWVANKNRKYERSQSWFDVKKFLLFFEKEYTKELKNIIPQFRWKSERPRDF